MSFTITCNKANPPIGGLAALYFVSGKLPVKVEWSDKPTSLTFPDNTTEICPNNNDVLRTIARFAKGFSLYGKNPTESTQIDHYLTKSLTSTTGFVNTLAYLQKCLAALTYLVANQVTIADLAIFHQLFLESQSDEKLQIPSHVQRWYNLIKASNCVVSALKAVPADVLAAMKSSKGASNNNSGGDKKGERKQEGKFVDLPGAEMGKVVVRFPPEASGFLHIGHAKAALLNQYYQQAFEGKLIMRFDDTNPAKENVHFEQVILEDLKMLDIHPDLFTHTSQYFDLMLEYCERLMKEGKAYCDDTEPEQMKKERELREESKNRSNNVEKNFEMWREMLAGSAKGQKCCVRAKINMQSPNGCLRDPTIYRCKNEPHPRTGTQYKVYPTYDFACPIVDAIEDVTHTLRTMEYHDRDDQFYWFIENLNLRRPYIWEYSRLNMTNTVLSKRKLTWFVEEGLVDGWDDPRMPTVRGILRRGMTVEGLRQFIIAQGSSKSVVFMEWDKIWAFNKKVIDPIAPRYTALEKDKRVVVNVKGAKSEILKAALHPKNTEIGEKSVHLGPKVTIDYVDAEVLKENENATFINWGNLLIKKINRQNGVITSIDADLNLDNKDFKKTTKLTWLCELKPEEYTPTFCVYFEHIVSKAILARDEDFKKFIGHQTRLELEMIGDPELKNCKKGDIIQLQRRGFFIVDEPYSPPSEFSNKTGPIILFFIPDGHSKDMPTMSGKIKTNEESKVQTVDATQIHQKIVAQGELVRDLKTKKAAKDQVDVAVKSLLALKAEYKAATGSDWKPGQEPPKQAAAPSTSGSNDLNDKIVSKGNLVRDLKAKKAPKPEVDTAVKELLSLKAEFKAATGSDWKPGQEPPKPAAANGSSGSNALNDKIVAQGNLVRDLKGKKAAKPEVDAAVKELLSLKAEFKAATGSDWKPGQEPPKPAANTNSPGSNDINTKIVAQGNLVRDLKAKKAAKPEVDGAVKELLSLKAEFKAATGSDWKPPQEAPSKPAQSAAVQPKAQSGGQDIDAKIVAQGNLVRDIKAKKASKEEVDVAVKTLLSLKAEYKTLTGNDWKPGQAPVAKSVAPVTTSVPEVDASVLINDKIVAQGNLVRDLKGKKAAKAEIDTAVKTLLTLKGDYKTATGQEWKPGQEPAPKSAAKVEDNGESVINEKIALQGNVVRDLKTAKASKTDIDAAVKILLSLKTEFKEATGKDWKPSTDAAPQRSAAKAPQEPKKVAPKKKEPSPPKGDASKSASSNVKKQTRLGLEATKEDNLPEWYSQVLTKSEMIEYYDVSGCYILRHWSFAIWKVIKHWFDNEITKMGVKECYFPIFVSKAALEREKEHIADFAPEVAWVTKSGDSELAEHIAVRPTSETGMYPAYAKWIQSYRDLPIRLNQWNNVVRWEFKHPQPFLRTREFLWQEGHTAFADIKDAQQEVLDILDLYAMVYEDLLAIPVVKGRKTEKEKFAGADYTTTIEAFISASGRAIQGATSHHLGQNFSKMFEIGFDDPVTQEKKFVYQNSWGITTRTIGVMIMVHADNAGLVLPPRVACIQAIVIPCGITVSTKEADKQELMDYCKTVETELLSLNVRAEGDFRDNYSPGWKFNHWELKGVPLRIELGPKDLSQKQMIVVRRDTGEKITVKTDDLKTKIPQLLEDIHSNLLNKALIDLETHKKLTTDWTQFCEFLDDKNIILSPFCGDIPCEEKIKADSARNDADLEPGAPAMGAKSLCIPFKQPAEIKASDKCIHPDCTQKPKFYTLFGRSY